MSEVEAERALESPWYICGFSEDSFCELEQRNLEFRLRGHAHTDWWSLLYNAILRSLEQTHCTHMGFYIQSD